MMLNKKLKISLLLELVKSLQTITTWWNKTPYQKWCYIYAAGKILSKPIGIPLYEGKFTGTHTVHNMDYFKKFLELPHFKNFEEGFFTTHMYANRILECEGQLEKYIGQVEMCIQGVL